eukprot:gnl/MRDRNA2_/MRDRNA2_34514_c0_seq1.p1 gnl/MRDRNA2_/MRDRNA2_34514_c0~~gnl/MRDRNA2_/MRDRNA2_34514_c0_seq1.p1  ORF type:complete len:635 (-),score=89.71 gnl/MRDRNA2_/MRDRNA2_34514_c0_seq1:1148-3052(-)
MGKMSMVSQRSPQMAVRDRRLTAVQGITQSVQQSRSLPQVPSNIGCQIGSQLRARSPQTTCPPATFVHGSPTRGTSPSPPVPPPPWTGNAPARGRSPEPTWSSQWPRPMRSPQRCQVAQSPSYVPPLESQSHSAKRREASLSELGRSIQTLGNNISGQPASCLGGAPLQRYNSTSSLPQHQSSHLTRKPCMSTPEGRGRSVNSSLSNTPGPQSQKTQLHRLEKQSGAAPCSSWTPILQQRGPHTDGTLSQNDAGGASGTALLGSGNFVQDEPSYKTQSTPSSSDGSPTSNPSDPRSGATSTAVPEEANSDCPLYHSQAYMQGKEVHYTLEFHHSQDANHSQGVNEQVAGSTVQGTGTMTVTAVTGPAQGNESSVESVADHLLVEAQHGSFRSEQKAIEEKLGIMDHSLKVIEGQLGHALTLNEQGSGHDTPLTPVNHAQEKRYAVQASSEEVSPQGKAPQKGSPQTRSPPPRSSQHSCTGSPYMLVNVEQPSPARSQQERTPQARSPQVLQDRSNTPKTVVQAQHMSPARPLEMQHMSPSKPGEKQHVSPSMLEVQVHHLSPASKVLDAHLSAPSKVQHVSPAKKVIDAHVSAQIPLPFNVHDGHSSAASKKIDGAAYLCPSSRKLVLNTCLPQ